MGIEQKPLAELYMLSATAPEMGRTRLAANTFVPFVVR
jgi:hypothetical protein